MKKEPMIEISSSELLKAIDIFKAAYLVIMHEEAPSSWYTGMKKRHTIEKLFQSALLETVFYFHLRRPDEITTLNILINHKDLITKMFKFLKQQHKIKMREGNLKRRLGDQQ